MMANTKTGGRLDLVSPIFALKIKNFDVDTFLIFSVKRLFYFMFKYSHL